MPAQYLYPTGDESANLKQDYTGPAYCEDITKDWIHSNENFSHYSDDSYNKFRYYTNDSGTTPKFTYVNEGVSTYNDSKYITTSGLFAVSDTINVLKIQQPNLLPMTYLMFQSDGLSVTPSSVICNFRAKYEPVPYYSGYVEVYTYLVSSGKFINDERLLTSNYQYNTQEFLTSIEQSIYLNNVIASAITTLPSGSAFNNYSVNLINNPTYDIANRYNKSYIVIVPKMTYPSSFNILDGVFSLSAVEIIASGDYVSNNGLPLQIYGRENGRLISDRLTISHNKAYVYDDSAPHVVETYDTPWVGSGNNGYYYYESAFTTNNVSPQLCLNYSGINRSDIFRDCFFDFNQKPGSNNNCRFTSSKSSHTFNLASNLLLGASGAVYVGQSSNDLEVSASANSVIEDSFIQFRPDLVGVASGTLPSGHFSMWLGFAQIPDFQTNDIVLVKDYDGDFKVGVNSNGIYASMLDTDNNRVTINTASYGTSEYAMIVSYSGCLNIYSMDRFGNLGPTVSSDSFIRQRKSQPSGVVEFSVPQQTVGVDVKTLKLYEFGVVSSGISSEDLSKLDRYQLFPRIYNNNLLSTISSGDAYIQYQSNQSRRTYTRQDQSGVGYFVGRDIFLGDASLGGPLIWPGYFDEDVANLAINKYNIPYTDISIGCHIGGQGSRFYQDGSVYFSGWIDASTTNPSGFLADNLAIRLWKDESTKTSFAGQSINDSYLSHSISTQYILPTQDSLTYAGGAPGEYIKKSVTSSSGYYTYVDELVASAIDTDYVRYSGLHSGPSVSLDLLTEFKMSPLNNFAINSDYGGAVSFNFRAACSGLTGSPWPIGRVYDVFLTESSGFNGWHNNIIASALTGPVISGENFTNYVVPLTYNSTYHASDNLHSYPNVYLYFKILSDISSNFDIIRMSALEVAVTGDAGVMVPPTYGGNYEAVDQIRGKIAAGTITLRSGLNMYVVPLQEAIYYYDLYSTYGAEVDLYGHHIYNARVDKYDKSNVKHPTWDDADISMYFAGYPDMYNSGYIDTLRIHSAAIISDTWSLPPSGSSSGIALYTYGDAPMSSSLTLYVDGGESTDSLTLYLASSDLRNSGITLHTLNYETVNSGLTLYLPALQINNHFTLFLKSNPLPSATAYIPLSMHSTTNSGIIKDLSLYINSDGISKPCTLFTKSHDNDENSDSIPLFLKVDGERNSYIPLYIANSSILVTNSQKLFVQGYGVNEGANIYRSGHPLYLKAGDGEGWSKPMDLFLKVPEGSNSGVNLFIEGGTYVSKSLDLSMAQVLGAPGSGITMYTHGF